MTRIEKLEKEIQELRLEVARLEGRVHELSIHHVPLQPRIPKVQPWDLPNYRWGGSGDVLCQKNLSGLITYTTGSNTIAERGKPTFSFEEEDFKINE